MERLGCVLVVLSCSFLGMAQGTSLKKQRRVTNEILHIFMKIKRDITEKRRYLSQIIEDIAQERTGESWDFFKNISATISENPSRDFGDIWEEQLKNRTGFSLELIEILLPVGRILGQYGSERQGEVLDRLLEELQGLEERQRAEGDRVFPVYGAMGVSLGVFLSIVLI